MSPEVSPEMSLENSPPQKGGAGGCLLSPRIVDPCFVTPLVDHTRGGGGAGATTRGFRDVAKLGVAGGEGRVGEGAGIIFVEHIFGRSG